jgi:Uma2 family endonuclease
MSAITEIALNEEKEYEIVDGQPEEKQMGGTQHGGIGVRLIIELGVYVKAHHLGGVYGPDTSFRIGKNERLPDISFIAASRVPDEGEPEGAWPLAPDLAVEIISPTDLYEKVMTKVIDYLTAGVRQVWLISPEHRTATVYSSVTESKILQATDELDGGDVIPGFRCRVADLFQGPARA